MGGGEAEGQGAMEAQQLGKCVLSKLELGGEPHQAAETASA